MSTSLEPRRLPNLLLVVICFPLAAAGSVLWCAGLLPLWFHFPAIVLVALAVNSLAHDSLHGNVSEHRVLNDGVGWVCSFLAGLPRPLHVRAHGLHHSRPMSSLDPHRWMHGGPRVLLPLRWLTANLGYYRVLPGLPRADWPIVLAGVALYCLLVGLAPSRTLVGWVLPMQLSTAAFAFFTDWLPHGPLGRRVERQESKGAEVSGRFHAVTMWHQDHHRTPRLPFYQGPELLGRRRA